MGCVCATSCPKKIPCRFLSHLRAPLSWKSGRPGGAMSWQPFALRQLWTEQHKVRGAGYQCALVIQALPRSVPGAAVANCRHRDSVCCPHQRATGRQGCRQVSAGLAAVIAAVGWLLFTAQCRAAPRWHSCGFHSRMVPTGAAQVQGCSAGWASAAGAALGKAGS